MQARESHVELLRTANFAAQKHIHQRRKDKDATPYINHPLGVAELLVNVAGLDDLSTLQAVILHDTVEDTETTVTELQKNFGDKVAKIVSQVTDDRSLSKAERKKAQVDHAAQMSREAKLVKLADKLYNLRDLMKQQPESWSLAIIQGYFIWSKAVVDQMRGTNQKLEEALNHVFGSFFLFKDGRLYQCIPDGDTEKLLSDYYSSLM